MMTVNKGKKLLVLATSLLLLAGCSTGDITATPTFYKDEIVDVDGEELTHNQISVIYDALTDSSSSKEKVLEKVILALAEDYFGKYEEAYALKDATTYEQVKDFVDAHKFYNAKDENDEPLYTNEEKLLKLRYFVRNVNKRINNTFYDMVSGGTYAYRNRFNEEKLVQSLRAQLYTITDPSSGSWTKDVLVTKKYKDDVSPIIHLDSYKDYIERNILRTIYKDLVVEEYMFQENYPLLARSDARKITYVKLTKNNEYPIAHKLLLQAYAKRYIETEENGVGDLNLISEAWAGHPNMSDEAKQLLTDAGFETETKIIDGVSTTYYPATSYGKLIKDYSKITDSRYDTENESTFTGDNKYPKEVGLAMKTDEVALEDYVTTGWYYRNGSNSLTSEISKRLFELGVATNVDHLGVVTNEEGVVVSESKSVDFENGQYVTKKNGGYWLVPSISQKLDVDKYNYIITDPSDSSNAYMIQVEEAVASAKLSTNEENKNNYAHIRSGASLRREDSLFTEEIAREIAKLYNSNETYKKQSYVKFLKDSKIKYHDQDIYDYFKETYPSLFEDD